MSAVQELCNRYWTWRCEIDPEFASYLGVHKHDHLLTDNSLQNFDKHQKYCVHLLDDCATLKNTTGKLNFEDEIHLEALQADLQSYLDGLKCKGFLFPITCMDGIHLDFEFIVDWMKFECENDYVIYNKRLQQVPQRLARVEELFNEGIKQQQTLHHHSYCLIPDQISLHLRQAKDTVFYAPYKAQLTNNGLSATRKLELENEAVETITSKIQPAYRKLLEYLSKIYSHHLRSDIGACTLPNGNDYYKQCLRYHTSTTLTPQQIHDTGLAEVARIKQRMATIVQDLGYGSDIKAFMQFLLTDQQFYFTDKKELLCAYKEMCRKTISPKLTQLFHSVPESEMKIELCSESMSSCSVAFYIPGSMDGKRSGTFQMSGSNLSDNSKYEMPALCLHEGEPGHHFQFTCCALSKTLPDFRKNVHATYFNAPSAFPVHTGICEGWGLYAEYLGEELDIYEDPYTLFGRLSHEMHRACRLVVDTGLHQFGWSFEQACEYYYENTAIHKDVVEKEVRRYITWPGQACAYKIGELRIKELRQKANKSLGDRFDVRDFHQQVLDAGFVSLDILEKIIDHYIKETLDKC